MGMQPAPGRSSVNAPGRLREHFPSPFSLPLPTFSSTLQLEEGHLFKFYLNLYLPRVVARWEEGERTGLGRGTKPSSPSRPLLLASR